MPDLQVEVPEWYSQGQSPTSPSPLASTTTSPAKAPPAALESWDLLDGSLAALEQCPDSCQFLAMLSELDLKPLAGSAAELPERRASRGLFRWEVGPKITLPAVHSKFKLLPKLLPLLDAAAHDTIHV